MLMKAPNPSHADEGSLNNHKFPFGFLALLMGQACWLRGFTSPCGFIAWMLLCFSFATCF
jgi:hypothetical protein